MDISTKIPLLKKDEEGNRIYDCPVCKSGIITVRDDVFYGKCDNCEATLVDYKPLQHQEAFHKSSAQYRMNIGGFGSGKTTASCAELSAHALSTAGGRSLITAPTLSQVRDAVIPELVKFLPPWFVETTKMHPNPYFKLTNGHEILVFSSQDQEKLRSLNLTAFYIEEASGVDYSIFDQLMTRLRNKTAIIRDENGDEIGYKFMGIVSTNPEDGWIKDRFLLNSSVIIGSPSVDTSVYDHIKVNKPDKHFHSFISSTRDNVYIPKNFIERASAGKGAKWVRKYIDCYLDNKEGAVFPDYSKYVVEPFPIPKDWQRIVGFDPGFNDPTACPKAAIEPSTGVVYVYDDYKVEEQPMSYHAKHLKEALKGLNLLFSVQADPAVQHRNVRDGISYSDYFYRQSGIYLEPGNNDILYGIEKVRDYMYCGKLKFFSDLNNLKFEAVNYIYPEKGTNTNDKPQDKHNHLWDAIRYMVAKLPRDPNELNEHYTQSALLNSTYSTFTDAIEKEETYLDTDGVYGGFKL